MADFVVATGTALKKKNILNKNCAGNVLPSGPAKKIPNQKKLTVPLMLALWCRSMLHWRIMSGRKRTKDQNTATLKTRRCTMEPRGLEARQ